VQRPARSPRCDLGPGGLGGIHRGITIQPDEHIQVALSMLYCTYQHAMAAAAPTA
jgi:hypothetical protein